MYEKELELAIRAAREAGEILKQRSDVRVDSDEGKDIKLSSDKNSERAIISLLSAHSDYPILSEECGMVEREHKDGYLWIIDPLDGTANYLKGLTELTCVSIALWKNGEPVLGVVYRYAVDELYYGVIGQGAFCNGSPMRTNATCLVSKATVATGFPVHRDYGDESLQSFVRLIQRFKKVRMLGAAAVMGTFVAAGRVDAYMEDHIMLWDIAAAVAIVTAAGGAASVELLEENMCICKLFANEKLMEDFYAESV